MVVMVGVCFISSVKIVNAGCHSIESQSFSSLGLIRSDSFSIFSTNQFLLAGLLAGLLS